MRFLAPPASGHRGAERRAACRPCRPASWSSPLAARAVEATAARTALAVGLGSAAEPAADGELEVALRVENRTPCEPGSTGPARWRARCSRPTRCCASPAGGSSRRWSAPCASVNTFPVLATDADDAVLGAAIVLPDHPQIAPESRGGLFDSTEIEEALLLHVQVLSDAERAEIERGRPGGARDGRAGARRRRRGSIAALHGRVTLRDPRDDLPARAAARASPTRAPARTRPRSTASPSAAAATCGSGPAPDADLHARLLDGRSATIERIFVDYDGKTHLGVTVDDDPGQELMRETSRLLFFFAPEVEVIE